MTTLTAPEHIKRYSGLSSRAQLKLVTAGMKSRVCQTDILMCVCVCHKDAQGGKTYKPGQVNLAIQDLGALYKEIV